MLRGARALGVWLRRVRSARCVVRSCSSASGSGSSGGAVDRTRDAYRRLQSERETDAKLRQPVQRHSRLREAFESQHRSLRDGELPGVASLGGVGEFSRVEAQIRREIDEGKLDNLDGAHKPLRRDTDGLRMWVDDAGMRVINRILETNGFKPRSLELKEEVHDKTTQLRVSLAAMIGPDDVCGDAFADSERVARLHTIADKCNEKIKEYNDSVLRDLLTYGSGWPLAQQRALDLRQVARDCWNNQQSK